MPGCTLFVSTDILVPLSAPAASYPMPQSAGLLGRSFYLQALASDPLVNLLGAVRIGSDAEWEAHERFLSKDCG